MREDFDEQAETVSEHQQAADELAEKVVTRALNGANAIGADIRREALTLLRKLLRTKPAPGRLLVEFLRGFRAILRRYEPVLARTASDAELAAWLQGGHGVLKHVPGKPPPLPPLLLPDLGGQPPIVRFPIIDEAARDLAARRILSPAEFYARAQAGQIQGFTISRMASLDAIEKARDLLTEALVEGETLPQWKAKVEEAVDTSRLSPARMETVFRNAVNGGYARGQKYVVNHPLVRSAFQFAWRSEIRDSRLTELCDVLSHSGLEGTSIYSLEDPTWPRVAPMSHWQCRCGVIFLSIERAAAKGLRIAQKWLASGQRPPDEELFVPMPDVTGLEGWSPLWVPTWTQQAQAA